MKLTILIYSNKVHQIDKLDNSAYNIDRIMPLFNLEILVKVFCKVKYLNYCLTYSIETYNTYL
jgi:hypothetical protein